MSHSTNADSHTRTSNQLYEYTHAHPTHMSTFERLFRLDLEIHKVGQKTSRCRQRRRLPLKK
jgi:hypothetical protein